MNTTSNPAPAPKVHKFELAGLGKAPFRIIGVEHRVGPITRTDPRTGIEITIGAPGQPMGCCAYCSQGIMECWIIRSADGKTFEVGCDCVGKAGDAGLKAQARPLLLEKAHARADRRIENVRVLLASPGVRELLSSKPSPNAHIKNRESDTLLDWVEWMLFHAGRAGMVRAARAVEAAVRAADGNTRGGPARETGAGIPRE